jgi:hypothetical protein
VKGKGVSDRRETGEKEKGYERNVVELGEGESAVDTGQDRGDEFRVDIIDGVLLLRRSLPLLPTLLPAVLTLIPRPLLPRNLLNLLLLLVIRVLLVRQTAEDVPEDLKVHIDHLRCNLTLLLLEHDLVERRDAVVPRVIPRMVPRCRSGSSGGLLLLLLLVVRIAAELDVGAGGGRGGGGGSGGMEVRGWRTSSETSRTRIGVIPGWF